MQLHHEANTGHTARRARGARFSRGQWDLAAKETPLWLNVEGSDRIPNATNALRGYNLGAPRPFRSSTLTTTVSRPGHIYILTLDLSTH